MFKTERKAAPQSAKAVRKVGVEGALEQRDEIWRAPLKHPNPPTGGNWGLLRVHGVCHPLRARGSGKQRTNDFGGACWGSLAPPRPGLFPLTRVDLPMTSKSR